MLLSGLALRLEVTAGWRLGPEVSQQVGGLQWALGGENEGTVLLDKLPPFTGPQPQTALSRSLWLPSLAIVLTKEVEPSYILYHLAQVLLCL